MIKNMMECKTCGWNIYGAKKLLKVKVFNRIQEERYRNDMTNWKSENGGMPYLPMYIFTKDNGVPYCKGYVVTEGNSHKFYHTKEEVFINEGIKVTI